MAEVLGMNHTINGADGTCNMELYYNDLTGTPTRAVMSNTTGRGYRFSIGAMSRLTLQRQLIPRDQAEFAIDATVALLIDMRDGAILDGWMCGIEGE